MVYFSVETIMHYLNVQNNSRGSTRFSQQLHCINLFIPSTQLRQASKGYRNALNWFQERAYASEEEETRRKNFALIFFLDLVLVNLKLKRRVTANTCSVIFTHANAPQSHENRHTQLNNNT